MNTTIKIIESGRLIERGTITETIIRTVDFIGCIYQKNMNNYTLFPTGKFSGQIMSYIDFDELSIKDSSERKFENMYIENEIKRIDNDITFKEYRKKQDIVKSFIAIDFTLIDFDCLKGYKYFLIPKSDSILVNYNLDVEYIYSNRTYSETFHFKEKKSWKKESKENFYMSRNKNKDIQLKLNQ